MERQGPQTSIMGALCSYVGQKRELLRAEIRVAFKPHSRTTENRTKKDLNAKHGRAEQATRQTTREQMRRPRSMSLSLEKRGPQS